MEPSVTHDEKRHRFVISLDEGEATLDYEPAGDGKLDYRSTFVPEARRGEGIGGELVMQALEYAREEGVRVIPTCPFVSWVVEQNPQYEDVIAG